VTCNARYALLLNVDTELLEGDLGSLVAALDARPSTGAAGVRQVTPRGDVAPTIRWFPSALRALGESLGAERWPVRSQRLGERELDLSAYQREQLCDWVSGSFLVLRSEVLAGVGLLDERFFLYSEEPDLCLRLKRAGWEVRYLPILTILHHAGNTGATPRLAAQDAYSRKQFAQKHFSVSQRAAYRASLAVGYAIRSVSPSPAARRAAARAALRAILGLGSPPFAAPPSRSLASRPAVHR
jgi:GT2 family glycosyltransferase